MVTGILLGALVGFFLGILLVIIDAYRSIEYPAKDHIAEPLKRSPMKDKEEFNPNDL